MAKKRVDVVLVERGLFESRNKAAAAVMAGEVAFAADGRRIDKPGQAVDEQAELQVANQDGFVSRGGVKLANALTAFTGLELAGKDCLDAGASTGGFTDCLLRAGVRHVAAVDVAYGELHWKLRSDSRVTVIERCNVRQLEADQLPFRPELIVADLSFIALTKVLPALVACAAEAFDMVVLVKPQFEVGRERVGKGGVVREAAVRRDAIAMVIAGGLELGLELAGVVSSGLPGPKGNQESFVWFGRGPQVVALPVEQTLDQVEPL